MTTGLVILSLVLNVVLWLHLRDYEKEQEKEIAELRRRLDQVREVLISFEGRMIHVAPCNFRVQPPPLQ